MSWYKQISWPKVMRNALVAIVSMGWFVPISTGISWFFLWQYGAHQPGYGEAGDSGFDLQMARGYIHLGLMWFAIVCGFWAFVTANRLWSIGKESKPTKEDA